MSDRSYPETRALLEELAAAALPGDPAFDLAASRAAATAGAPATTSRGRRCDATDIDVDGVPCRVYRPVDAAPAGTVVHVHGGGFVEGDLATHDAVCREVAVASGWAVVAVDYRLAPEHPFPAAYEDVEALADAVAAGRLDLPVRPLALLGDSAGGTIVAGMTLRERRAARSAARSRYALQVLVYPGCGLQEAPAPPAEIARGFGLTPEAMRWYVEAFAPDPADQVCEDVTPLRARSYAGLPPAVVITADLDPLRSCGEEYAARLAAADVPVVCTRYVGTVHGFWRRPASLAVSVAAVDQVASALRRV